MIEPTRTSDITPTRTPAIASAITEVRTDQPQVSSSSYSGLKRSRWVFSEKKRPSDVGGDEDDRDRQREVLDGAP